jgi:hypothetical protein
MSCWCLKSFIFGAGHPWLIPVILAIWETEMRRIAVQGQHVEIACETISKITRAKWTGDVAQVAEHLLCKVLTSNPSPTKTNQQTPPKKQK